MSKRKPEKELNHDNWDVEEKREDRGEFVKASVDVLKQRVFAKPRRRLAQREKRSNVAATDTSKPTNPFSAFVGFGINSASGVSINEAKTENPFAGFEMKKRILEPATVVPETLEHNKTIDTPTLSNVLEDHKEPTSANPSDDESVKTNSLLPAISEPADTTVLPDEVVNN